MSLLRLAFPSADAGILVIPVYALQLGTIWHQVFAVRYAHAFGDQLGMKADREWDAGDKGCGELVLELSRRLKELEAGQLLKLIALDSGAQEDLPAWCKLTGHKLLRSEHPEYWIEKKQKG